MAKGGKLPVKAYTGDQSKWLTTISEKKASISLKTEDNFYCQVCGRYFESHFLQCVFQNICPP